MRMFFAHDVAGVNVTRGQAARHASGRPTLAPPGDVDSESKRGVEAWASESRVARVRRCARIWSITDA